jgi:hypothetical protein
MRGDSTLRLTGLFFMIGQLLGFILAICIAKPERSYWYWQGFLLMIGFILLIAFNYKYWIGDLRKWRRKRMFGKLLRQGSEGTLTPVGKKKLLNRSYEN